MSKILLMPDSFKGTMSSLEICEIIAPICRQYFPKDQVFSLPIADGGEGTVNSFIHILGGKTKTLRVRGPLGKPVEAEYGLLDDNTAVVEMASAAGLPLLKGKLDVMNSNTLGVGQILRHLIDNGIRKIYLGLGGSCTNDGGAAAATALGVKFLNSEGREFIPAGSTLSDIQDIDLNDIPSSVLETEIKLLCDIDNTVCGANGAVSVFAKQKGASQTQKEHLEYGLQNFTKILSQKLNHDLFNTPAGAAAGGMGLGFIAMLSAKPSMGIDILLDLCNFEAKLKDARFIMTGEGKLDQQSLAGKVVMGIARRAKRHNVPVFALVGDIGENIDDAYEQGVSGVFSINRLAIPYSQAKLHAREDLAFAAENLLRVLAKLMS